MPVPEPLRRNADHVPTEDEIESARAGLGTARQLLVEKEQARDAVAAEVQELNERLEDQAQDSPGGVERLALGARYAEVIADYEYHAGWVRALETCARGETIGAHQVSGV